MNMNCCGTRLKSIDIVSYIIKPVIQDGKTLYETIRITEKKASWQCTVCGKIKTQGLRLPKKS